MLFRYCVPKAVSSTEFYPIPYYESVYLENQCFTIEADNQYQADEKAYRFLANLQKKHDLAYEKLLDEQGIRFRKREEIIERRLIYLRDLRRPGDPDSFGSQNVNFQRFPTLDAKKLVNAPKMSAHHRGICHF